MELNFNEIRELLAVLQQTDIAELSIKSSDFELSIRKDRAGSDRPPEPALELPPAAPPALPTPTVAPTPPPKADRLLEVVSPMVGTFYRAPGPEEPPYVDVGDRIRVGQAVCIIEAMKLMNELEAEVAGEIVEILAQNGQPVEYGQPLMRVNPG